MTLRTQHDANEAVRGLLVRGYTTDQLQSAVTSVIAEQFQSVVTLGKRVGVDPSDPRHAPFSEWMD